VSIEAASVAEDVLDGTQQGGGRWSAVEHRDVVARRDESPDHGGADEPGAADDENPHPSPPSRP
jgi:hypothetical protein